jgi:NAD dependent epimerase/dehydratase family enzyme
MRIAWGDRSVLALTNQRVSSKKLIDAGFTFQYPTIEQAIQHLSNHPTV